MTIAPRTAKYTVRLSSSQPGGEGACAPASGAYPASLRTQLIDLLRKADCRVINGKGTQVIELQTMQRKSISVSDAFVFLPRPTLAEGFKLTSLVVGYQTNDPELKGKPAAVLQLDNTSGPVLDIFRHLETQGMISAPEQLFTVLDSVEQVAPAIKTLAGQDSPEGFNQTSAQGFDLPQSTIAGAGRQLTKQASRHRRSSVPKFNDIPAFNVGVFGPPTPGRITSNAAPTSWGNIWREKG